jgi:hypothetical protein
VNIENIDKQKHFKWSGIVPSSINKQTEKYLEKYLFKCTHEVKHTLITA